MYWLESSSSIQGIFFLVVAGSNETSATNNKIGTNNTNEKKNSTQYTVNLGPKMTKKNQMGAHEVTFGESISLHGAMGHH